MGSKAEIRSTYSLPSTSHTRAPSPWVRNIGAAAGNCTCDLLSVCAPSGMTFKARDSSCCETCVERAAGEELAIEPVRPTAGVDIRDIVGLGMALQRDQHAGDRRVE